MSRLYTCTYNLVWSKKISSHRITDCPHLDLPNHRFYSPEIDCDPRRLEHGRLNQLKFRLVLYNCKAVLKLVKESKEKRFVIQKTGAKCKCLKIPIGITTFHNVLSLCVHHHIHKGIILQQPENSTNPQ